MSFFYHAELWCLSLAHNVFILIIVPSFKDNQSNTTHMDVSQVLVKLKGVLHAITRGDYDVSRDIEVYLDEQEQPKEVVDFAEQLNFMSLKLEARKWHLKRPLMNWQ